MAPQLGSQRRVAIGAAEIEEDVGVEDGEVGPRARPVVDLRAPVAPGQEQPRQGRFR